MQIPGRLNAMVDSAWHIIAHGNTSKKITVSLSAITSVMLLSNVQIPNAYAHVSHVLPASQYANIKSGYPDIEIIAAAITGFIVLSAVLVQSFQKHRRRLPIC